MASIKPNNVTLLHKGLGPSLFQYRSKPYPIPLRDSPVCTPRGCGKPARKVIVKCVDRQDANSMFEKRLRSRDKSGRAQFLSRPTPSKRNLRLSNSPFIREQLFSVRRKPDGFPPPSFMPRWNPRHMDRTYLDKMILDDPWSLPPEKRRELQRKTGMRLKSISRHYQYKVRGNLPYGKEALDSTCTCFVEFCEHCSKKHADYRCPLHMQLLEGAQSDCRTELGEFCPFKKNPEDLPLRKIKDVDVYVSEVVRRLRAGEITEAPPFPNSLLWDRNKWNEMNLKKAAVETSSQLELGKKAETEDAFAQTESYMTEVDLSNAKKENLCQTAKPPSDTPLLAIGITNLSTDLPYFAHGNYQEESTQVTPFMIVPYDDLSSRFTKKMAAKILHQSLLEVRDETVIHDIQTQSATFGQQLMDIQRREYFRLIQEQFRTAAYAQEETNLMQEIIMESSASGAVEAILFSQLFFRDFAMQAMDSLRIDGYLVNEDLKAIQGELKADLNSSVKDKLKLRNKSIELLDDIIVHALNDVEMDAYLSNIISQSYFDPLNWTTRQLVDLIRMREENLQILEKIRKLLGRKGWVMGSKMGQDDELKGTPSSTSDDSLGAFLQKIRVSVDSEGNPKYLVDSMGRPLPINVVWIPYLAEQMAKTDAHTGKSVWDSKKTFDIVLSKESVSTLEDSLDQDQDEGPMTNVTVRSRTGTSQMLSSKSTGEVDISFDDEEEQQEEDDEDEDLGKILFKISSQVFDDDETLNDA